LFSLAGLEPSIHGSLSEIVLATRGKSMEVNGIAPMFLTASNFERSREFYRRLLSFPGLKPANVKRP
jgi:hypothetical protein